MLLAEAHGDDASLGAEAGLARPDHFPADDNWLPEDEAVQLRFDFESGMARLNAA
jgi:hypothetical protein